MPNISTLMGRFVTIGRKKSIPWYLSGGIPLSSVVAVYYPKGAASLADSYKNIVNNSTHLLSASPAPDLTSNGWSFTATQRLISDIVPTQTYGVVLRLFSATSGAALGVYQYVAPTGGFLLAPIISGNSYFYGPGEYAGTSVSSGSMAMGGGRAYINGVDVGSVAGTWPIINHGLYIGCNASNNDGGVFNQLTGVISGLAVYDPCPTPAQLIKVSTAPLP